MKWDYSTGGINFCPFLVNAKRELSDFSGCSYVPKRNVNLNIRLKFTFYIVEQMT